MPTGSNLLPSMQQPSHCVSWGQTRPVIAGRILSSRILAAPRVVALGNEVDERGC
jgi:hypothetical protein